MADPTLQAAAAIVEEESLKRHGTAGSETSHSVDARHAAVRHLLGRGTDAADQRSERRVKRKGAVSCHTLPAQRATQQTATKTRLQSSTVQHDDEQRRAASSTAVQGPCSVDVCAAAQRHVRSEGLCTDKTRSNLGAQALRPRMHQSGFFVYVYVFVNKSTTTRRRARHRMQAHSHTPVDTRTHKKKGRERQGRARHTTHFHRRPQHRRTTTTFAKHDQSAPRPPACTSTLAHTCTPSAHARRTPTSTPPQCRHSSRPPPPPPHVVGVTTLLSDAHTSHGSVALCATTSPASWRISPHRRIHFHSTPSTTDHL